MDIAWPKNMSYLGHMAISHPSDSFSVFYLSSLHFSPLPDKIGIFLSETPILVIVTCHFGEKKKPSYHHAQLISKRTLFKDQSVENQFAIFSSSRRVTDFFFKNSEIAIKLKAYEL